ncbi:uncharacterized protein LOC127866637 [Dreissena polymorpha]|uniref:Uncharacterized protein n=1 Tax=Dreissena polymorpha TaxID=45954 RepID=A0A9D4LT54_DREPO|nr:uncharacterized protein LOC127866637 [Dreissena polymorpha]KAH3863725.1 hypothetical protein DPMN_026722 [Dreissena polymorpha]
MRPAVYASVMRNRKPGARRRPKSAPHVFSWQRFFLIVFLGTVSFIPGLIVTIIGIHVPGVPGDEVFFKYIGPASLAVGVGLIAAAGLYYCCWGVQSPVSAKNSAKHKKSVDRSDNYDPLQNPSVAAISDNGNCQSPRASVKSNRNSRPTTPDQKSGRPSNGGQRYRTTSRTSLDLQRSQGHQNSRHRHSSYSHNSRSYVPTPAALSAAVASETPADIIVAFLPECAPLAQSETASVDVTIDIEPDIHGDKNV